VYRSVVGIAVAVVLVPSSASAVVIPRHHSAPAHPAASSMRAVGEGWLATQRQAMTAAGATVIGAPETSGIGAVAGMHVSSIGNLVAAGDLAGKGHDDVLDVREAEPGGLYGVTARDGLTGKVVWAKALTEPPSAEVSILPEREGQAGGARHRRLAGRRHDHLDPDRRG
jgi:hypothetical protein